MLPDIPGWEGFGFYTASVLMHLMVLDAPWQRRKRLAVFRFIVLMHLMVLGAP